MTAPRVSFAATIVATPIAPSYRIGLVVVAAAMMLLPAIYLGLIAATVALVVKHLTANTWILSGRSVGWVRLLFYIAPAFAGTVLAFFLVKPVLAPRAKQQTPVRLERDDEPAFFALIDGICGQVRAPAPAQVQVDCSVNASASFMGGPLALFRRRLVLTVGLPLVAGLSVRELSGVLAHEFGHFAQGGGMRLTWIVRSINGWFARVVYERDEWDERIEAWRETSDVRLQVMVLLASGCVWLSRRALEGLLKAGHAISCFMLRQMEYDADSYEIKISGSDAFSRTMTRLRELTVGAQLAYQSLGQSRALPADLAGFFVEKSRHLPEEVAAQLRGVPDDETGVFDTHPSDRDRIRAAERADASGALVGGDEPASSLFTDFDTLSTAATRHHYEHVVGIEVDAASLVSREDVARLDAERRARVAAMRAFFGDRVSVGRPLQISLVDFSRLSTHELQTRGASARAEMFASDVAAPEAYRAFESLSVRADRAFYAEEVWQAGLRVVEPNQFELATGSLDDAEATQQWAAGQQRELAPALDRYDRAASTRLACGLALAVRRVPPVDVRALADAFDATARALPYALALPRYLNAQHVLGASVTPGADTASVAARIELLAARVATTAARLNESFGDTSYPLSDVKEPTTLVAWCGFESGELTVEPAVVLQRVTTLYWELLARIVSIVAAEEAEALPLS